MTLALDTATPATVAGATGPGGTPGVSRIELPGPGERPGHTRLLLGLAEEVLAGTGGTWDDVGRIVLGLGPGTFTGIRVGVATGRALALSTGAGLVGVPTPWALAEAVGGAGGTHEGRPVLVVQDARRRELFLTLFPDGGPGGAGGVPGGPADHGARADADAQPDPIAERASGPAPFTAAQDDLAAALAALSVAPAVAVGDGALAFADVLREAGVEVPEDPAAHRVDGLALIRAAAGRPVVAPDLVRPVYVRDADAVPTADRR
ncbi:tRNA (adenosine(37)-N6)-threonylcarbamoyltransferase complex dimerization subunit type 1 TsaB [Patulibacter sp.]|uniref:tRNA (adenosine(37)-N6)-threonylcarbamoyltransferase complex dimerization subunit type 1 TsaB n=1 Tax=Patulibacter sp. TaxID=1912859 RepID=UPI002718AEE6|nr:tRNA (adenosine(37)-N6)-threonylcarbamoyltransferase complex dimerization subunit type 1 TsaB [Patulibacter sp.]MDO9410048.1 tRNA (adenosine(37)-N6)-threonylcarbamoyltransferase complex dimerization subunit type 1 TsaB [Patulibacter sp.]